MYICEPGMFGLSKQLKMQCEKHKKPARSKTFLGFEPRTHDGLFSKLIVAHGPALIRKILHSFIFTLSLHAQNLVVKQKGDALTRLMPEMRLANTDCALRPTRTVLTPPTVSRGCTLMPRMARHMRLPAHTTTQLASPLTGSITRSRALP